MSEFYQKSQQLTPDMYQRFKTALELGKWPDGLPVSDKQRAILTEAIIIYDNANIPAGQRIGDLDDQCASKADETLKWQ